MHRHRHPRDTECSKALDMIMGCWAWLCRARQRTNAPPHRQRRRCMHHSGPARPAKRRAGPIPLTMISLPSRSFKGVFSMFEQCGMSRCSGMCFFTISVIPEGTKRGQMETATSRSDGGMAFAMDHDQRPERDVQSSQPER